MKFSEMTYTRPDINALLARCKQLAARIERKSCCDLDNLKKEAE